MRETVTEQKVVEEQRQVKICDYCRLFTSDDIEEGKSFGEVMLNARMSNSMLQGHYNIICRSLAETDDAEQVHQIIQNALVKHDDTIDLCPHCIEDLFGEGPVSMRRDGSDGFK